MLIKRMIIFMLLFSLSFAVMACSDDEGDAKQAHISGMSVNAAGELIIEFSDGTTENLGVVGQDGTAGQDGISVVDVFVNDQGELILELSDGSSINAGVVALPEDHDGTDGLVFSEVGEEDGISYAVSGYIGTDPHVVIPETFKGKPVVSILPVAFGDFGFDDNGCDFLKSVHIPASVRTIEDMAFLLAVGLETVTFADDSALVKIGKSVFYENISLTSIVIPQGVTHIGEWAFDGATSLETIVFENSDIIQHVGRGAFGSTPFLNTIEGAFILGEVYVHYGGEMDPDTELVIPEGITVIFERVFRDQENLISVTIPASVREIGWDAFARTTALTTVVFEAGSQLQSIENGLFDDSALTSINLPATVTSIGYSAFRNTALESIVIPASVKHIRPLAFQNTTSLVTVTFEAGSQLESIGHDAFRNSALESIDIPASVKHIDYRAFQNTTSLATVTFEAESQLQSIGWSAFKDSGFTIIHIPENVTKIEGEAFTSMQWLEEIHIPLSVVQMDENTIASSAALIIYTEHTEKPDGWHANWNPSNHDVVWDHSD